MAQPNAQQLSWERTIPASRTVLRQGLTPTPSSPMTSADFVLVSRHALLQLLPTDADDHRKLGSH